MEDSKKRRSAIDLPSGNYTVDNLPIDLVESGTRFVWNQIHAQPKPEWQMDFFCCWCNSMVILSGGNKWDCGAKRASINIHKSDRKEIVL